MSDDTLPHGHRVYKGWRVTYVAYAMGRMVKIWGEDAAEFRPERFLGPDGSFRPESPFKYPAFNAGPRLCLGKEMAYVQVQECPSMHHYMLQCNVYAIIYIFLFY